MISLDIFLKAGKITAWSEYFKAFDSKEGDGGRNIRI